MQMHHFQPITHNKLLLAKFGAAITKHESAIVVVSMVKLFRRFGNEPIFCVYVSKSYYFER